MDTDNANDVEVELTQSNPSSSNVDLNMKNPQSTSLKVLQQKASASRITIILNPDASDTILRKNEIEVKQRDVKRASSLLLSYMGKASENTIKLEQEIARASSMTINIRNSKYVEPSVGPTLGDNTVRDVLKVWKIPYVEGAAVQSV